MITLTKLEYLHELERKLAVLPEADRQSALQYYENHISTAPDEAAAIAALGAPGEVAAEVLAGYVRRSNGSPPAGRPMPTPAEGSAPMGMGMVHAPSRTKQYSGIFSHWWVIVLLAVFGLPLIIGLGGGLFGMTIGIGSGLLAFMVSGFVMVATGAVSLLMSVFILFQDFGFGLLTAGAGLVLLGLGIIFIRWASYAFHGIIWLVKKFIRMVQNGRAKHA